VKNKIDRGTYIACKHALDFRNFGDYHSASLQFMHSQLFELKMVKVKYKRWGCRERHLAKVHCIAGRYVMVNVKNKKPFEFERLLPEPWWTNRRT
jgi:hypothetical protein